MGIYKREGEPDYRYDFQLRGKRFFGRTGCTKERDAKNWIKAEKERLKAITIDESKLVLTMLDAAARFDEEVIKAKHSRTVDSRRNLNWLVDKLGESTVLTDVGDEKVARLIAKKRGEQSARGGDLAPASINRAVLEPLRALLRRARTVWKCSTQEISWKDHWLEEPQERVRVASTEEEAAIRMSMRGDYEPALLFALLSGCRREEIVGLRWANVRIFDANPRNRNFTVIGKGRNKQKKERTVPMSKAIYDLLLPLIGNHPEFVFTYIAARASQAKGKCRGDRVRGQRYPITDAGFKTEWRRTKARAEKLGIALEGLRFHDTRHTAATRLVKASRDIRHAQKMLGHVDIQTTMKYAHVLNDDLQDAMDAMSHNESHNDAVLKAANNLKLKVK